MIDRKKFINDWVTNASTLAVLALTGIVLNSVIAKHYGTVALGIFNQVYAVYILGSQIATFGIQFSVLRYASEFGQDQERISRILRSGILMVAIAAAATVLIMLALFWVFSSSIYSTAVVNGVLLMLPGLWCFALNKVLLNALNAVQAHKLYAAFSSLRYLLILLALLGAVVIDLSGHQLGLILSLSEGTLLLILGTSCLLRFPALLRPGGREWIAVHSKFGARSLAGGLAIEANSRVDVLILGAFTDDASVGVYSFAAFFMEGLLQLPAVSRRLVNPVLTHLALRDVAALPALLRKGRDLSLLLAAGLGCGAVLTYPWFASVVGTAELAQQSWPVFAVLMAGASTFAVYATFTDIFSQAGNPVLQSRFNLAVLGLNIALNMVIVPTFGLIGAAAATSASFVGGTLYFRSLVRRHLAVAF